MVSLRGAVGYITAATFVLLGRAEPEVLKHFPSSLARRNASNEKNCCQMKNIWHPHFVGSPKQTLCPKFFGGDPQTKNKKKKNKKGKASPPPKYGQNSDKKAFFGDKILAENSFPFYTPINTPLHVGHACPTPSPRKNIRALCFGVFSLAQPRFPNHHF